MAIDSLAISLFSRANSTTVAINIAHEIQCYSLPYGGLGFTSNVLTCYTVICLWNGRKPMWPFRRLKYSWLDLALGVVGLCVSTAMAIVTIVKCRNTWQLLVIAVWKLSMSLLNGVTAIHVAVILLGNSLEGRKKGAELEVPMGEMAPGQVQEQAIQSVSSEEIPFRSVSRSALLYLPGLIAGMCGLMNLVNHSEGYKGVGEITMGFYITVGVGVVHVVFTLYKHCFERGQHITISLKFLAWEIALLPFLAIFYCDWVLGMMTTNLVGLPSKESSVFYWMYFVSKRLPMLSW